MGSSNGRLRLGVIGCGVIGKSHIKAAAANPRVDLVAIADLNQEMAKQVAAENGNPRIYAEAAALIADREVDAVVTAMPTGVRTPVVLSALAAGKHVLVEKPVAANARDAEKILAARGDRVVGVCSARVALHGIAEAARKIVESDELGAIRVVRGRGLMGLGAPPRNPPPPWRLSRKLNGGGIMANWGCYDLNFLMEASGWQLKPRTVLAQMWTCPPAFEDRAAPGSDAETHVSALVQCEGGAVLTLERGEFLPMQTDTAWQITGERGSLRMNMLAWTGGPYLTLDRSVSEKGVESTVVMEGPVDREQPKLLIEDFARAVLDGVPPRTTLEQALLVQRITDAIYESSEAGRAVELAQEVSA